MSETQIRLELILMANGLWRATVGGQIAWYENDNGIPGRCLARSPASDQFDPQRTVYASAFPGDPPEQIESALAYAARMDKLEAMIRNLRIALWRFSNSSGTWDGKFQFCWCDQATAPDDAHNMRCQATRRADAEAEALVMNHQPRAAAQ